MAEYITRSDAIKAVNGQNAFTMTRGALIDVLNEIQAADVAPVVHAMWIPSESDFDDDDTLFDVTEWCDWKCSACKEDICYDDPMPMRLLPKYCPNCGAKMDGGNDNALD